MIVVVFVVCIQAMENEKRWSITTYGTKINLNKGDMLDYYYADDNKKIDIVMCVGQYKQEELGATPIGGLSAGCCCFFNGVRFAPEKDSINYEKARSNDWHFPLRDGICFLHVTEPHLMNYEGWMYWSSWDEEGYTGDLAVEMCCKDLSSCYKIVLDKGREPLCEKKNKNIALPMLGADFTCKEQGVPLDKAVPVAVEAIVEFTQNNPGAYNNIELFMETRLEYNKYKLLLMEKCGLIKKICLLYCAKHDLRSLLFLLPHELIYYIAQLV